MNDPWDEKTDEPTTAVAEKPESNPLAKIGEKLDILNATIPNLVIKTEEDRVKAHEARGLLKEYENSIKEYVEDNITPLDTKVKRLKKQVKPYTDKVKELIDAIKKANQKWDTAKLKAEEEEKRKAQEKLDKEQAKAMEKMLKAKKEGKPTPPKVLAKITEVVPPTSTAQRKSEKGTESVKLIEVWFILLQSGDDAGTINANGDTEWNRTTRLPLDRVKGRAGPAVPYVMVDRVQIQEAFDAGKELPHWIHVEKRADSRFRG